MCVASRACNTRRSLQHSAVAHATLGGAFCVLCHRRCTWPRNDHHLALHNLQIQIQGPPCPPVTQSCPGPSSQSRTPVALKTLPLVNATIRIVAPLSPPCPAPPVAPRPFLPVPHSCCDQPCSGSTAASAVCLLFSSALVSVQLGVRSDKDSAV